MHGVLTGTLMQVEPRTLMLTMFTIGLGPLESDLSCFPANLPKQSNSSDENRARQEAEAENKSTWAELHVSLACLGGASTEP